MYCVRFRPDEHGVKSIFHYFILQGRVLGHEFIVDHCIDVCSSFASIAEMICLSRDFDVGQEWKKIGTIE